MITKICQWTLVLAGIPVLGCGGGSGESDKPSKTWTQSTTEWIDWGGDGAKEIKRAVMRNINKVLDEQKVSLTQSPPVKQGNSYVQDINVVVEGSLSGRFERTYKGIECKENGDPTEAGMNFLKEKIEADKKAFQSLQW